MRRLNINAGWVSGLAAGLPAGDRRRRGGAAGRWLTAGLLVVLAAGWMFARVLDRPTLGFLAGHRTGWLTTLMRTVTTVGNPTGVTLLVAVAGVVWWRTRRWAPPVAAAVVLAGGGLIETVVKAAADRSRPPPDLAVPGVLAGGYAFPSGHATLAATAFGMLAVLLGRSGVGRVLRVAVWTVAVLATAAVGFSRLYLWCTG